MSEDAQTTYKIDVSVELLGPNDEGKFEPMKDGPPSAKTTEVAKAIQMLVQLGYTVVGDQKNLTFKMIAVSSLQRCKLHTGKDASGAPTDEETDDQRFKRVHLSHRIFERKRFITLDRDEYNLLRDAIINVQKSVPWVEYVALRHLAGKSQMLNETEETEETEDAGDGGDKV